jgi:hypothetical protein
LITELSPSISRLLERHKTRHLGVTGDAFANVRLNRRPSACGRWPTGASISW